MAVNEPVWSYGESKVFNSSGPSTDPDDAWSYGENRLIHEYEAAVLTVGLLVGGSMGLTMGSNCNLMTG